MDAKGITTLLDEPPTIDILGKEVKLQHLGLKHSFIVMDMAKRILSQGSLQAMLAAPKDSDRNLELGMQVLSDVMEDEEAISRFLAAVLGWSVEDVMDPNKLPIQYVPGVVEAFVRHPDLVSFIEQIKVKLTGLRIPSLKVTKAD